MTPQQRNEVRDLAPVVGSQAMRVSFVSTVALLVCATATLGAGLFACFAVTPSLYAVTESGETFAIAEVAEPARSRLLEARDAQLERRR